MDNFLHLPIEKQNKIIEAALSLFGQNGYKKASVGDIAKAAGIAKGMVFYYFGSKKELYLFLCNYCIDIVKTEIMAQDGINIPDYFERMLFFSKVKLEMMRRHPYILSFVTKLRKESDPEIAEELKELFAQNKSAWMPYTFEGVDISKFREGVDVKLVSKMIMWMAEGIGAQIERGADTDMDKIIDDFYSVMELMKNNLYIGGL